MLGVVARGAGNPGEKKNKKKKKKKKKGVDIEADLIPLGVKLNIPPFLKGKTQLSEKEMVETRRIASVHIHVERAMEWIKNYHIFDKDIPPLQLI